MAIDIKFVGKKYPTITYEIGREKVREFCKAIKVDDSLFTEIAPPTFPVVYTQDFLSDVLFDEEIKPNLNKLVHGEQQFLYHKPSKVGDTITSNGYIEKIFSKGSHDFLVYRINSENQNGELVCESVWTLIVRGGNDKDFTLKEKLMMKLASLAPSPSSRSQPKDLPTEIEDTANGKRVKIYIDKYRPQRYAGASGDFNAIHLDNDLGKSAGLGSYILHGMATMGMATNLFMHDKKPEEIKRYRVRFSAPVKPHDTLTYEGAFTDDKTYKFTAKNQNGADVLGACIVEFN